jgi:hypothetical protein
MKTKTILTLIALSVGFQNANAGIIDFTACMKEHRSILKEYDEQIESEAERIFKGIQFEKAKGTNAIIVNDLERLAGKILIKKIFSAALLKQIQLALQNPMYTQNPNAAYMVQRILNAEQIDPSDISHLKAMMHHLGEHYVKEVISEAITELGKETFHAIGNGLITKLVAGTALNGVTAATVAKASLHFSVDVLKSAGISLVLSIITKPLKGARLPPETMWAKALEHHPELILNPEWMIKAGVRDAPWFTHCLALERKKHELDHAFEKVLHSEEQLFLGTLHRILTSKRDQDLPKTVIYPADNTRVKIRKSLKQELPLWAITR